MNPESAYVRPVVPGKVEAIFGEGAGWFWGRLENRGRTFPGESWARGTVMAFPWGRPPAQKPTFPKKRGDLPQSAEAVSVAAPAPLPIEREM